MRSAATRSRSSPRRWSRASGILKARSGSTNGKGVGLVNKDTNQFPRFETYREQIDGKYWFPTYTRANDTLHFRDMDQRIRMVVKYQDYKKYEGRSTIKYGEVVDDGKSQGQPTTPPSTSTPAK